MSPAFGYTRAVEPASALIARQPKGTALLQEFYADREIFRRDVERVHPRHWLCVGHESRIREPPSPM